MNNFANLSSKADVLDSISTLEKELSSKIGKDVAVVAYSPVQYAALSDDSAALEKISELEKEIAAKTGKDVVLVAFTV